MDVGDIKFYEKRWQAVSEFELEELCSSTVKQNWGRLNAIRQRAARLSIARDDEDHEKEIYLRWAKLKAGA